MKTIFRNLKTLALVALVGGAAMVVSCDPITDPTPTPEDKTVAYVFDLDGNDVFFAVGEEKTIAVGEKQTVVGATIEAPEGWVVTGTEAGIVVVAPAQEGLDDGSAEVGGKVSASLKLECGTTLEGSFYVYVGETIVYLEETSATFNDIQIKAVIKGVDKYMMHIGTDGSWKSSFDEWQNPNPMLPEPPMFGCEGVYYDSFEGSLFTFANDPYAVNFMAMPGVTYDVAILPIDEGKALADYSYSDVYLYAFKTAEAGENGVVTPEFALTEQTHAQLRVEVSAADAYVTFWTYYKAAEFEQIGGRESVIKKDLIANGDRTSEAKFEAKKTGLSQGEKVYLVAISIDKDGNYGELKIQDFTTGMFTFNDMVVTLGDITCSDDGKTVYLPVTVTGGEVAEYRYAYIPTNRSEWNMTYGGSVEKAEIYIATVPNQYYGPKFVSPDQLVDGKIVVTSGPWPGTEARILVLALDVNGVPSHAAYAEYTPTESINTLLYKDDADYEYGMPNISFRDVTNETLADGTKKYWVNFNIDLSEQTKIAWVMVAGEEYTDGRTPYDLVFSWMIVENSFMYNKAYTEDGVFSADVMFCYNEDTRSAVYVVWQDDLDRYHETKLFYDPVAAAQSHLPK